MLHSKSIPNCTNNALTYCIPIYAVAKLQYYTHSTCIPLTKQSMLFKNLEQFWLLNVGPNQAFIIYSEQRAGKDLHKPPGRSHHGSDALGRAKRGLLLPCPSTLGLGWLACHQQISFLCPSSLILSSFWPSFLSTMEFGPYICLFQT